MQQEGVAGWGCSWRGWARPHAISLTACMASCCRDGHLTGKLSGCPCLQTQWAIEDPSSGNPGWTVLYKHDMASGMSGGLSNAQCTVQQDVSLSGADIVTDREPITMPCPELLQ